MLTTTIVLSASFLIYTLSSMKNLFNFGVLTAFAIFYHQWVSEHSVPPVQL